MDTTVEVPTFVSGFGKRLMKRFAAAIIVASVLLVAASPAAAACCMPRPTNSMASMHASMPCCQTCKLTAPKAQREADATLTSVAVPQPVFLALNAVEPAVSQAANPSTFDGSSSAEASASPPSFVLLHQFRI